ncbi:hypothetical protein BGZ70_004944 [Mortierella alpina]|uniref:Potassium channel domain-containing protein n=1 Tax=Mortierella alpina TaxID=64518 RepID=A0A9P6M4H4_MORAP|nr:hypothetical protein BGZ70_004944 [Mortierella alpina]
MSMPSRPPSDAQQQGEQGEQGTMRRRDESDPCSQDEDMEAEDTTPYSPAQAIRLSCFLIHLAVSVVAIRLYFSELTSAAPVRRTQKRTVCIVNCIQRPPPSSQHSGRCEFMANHTHEEGSPSSSTVRRGRSSTEEHMSDNTYNASSTEIGHSDNGESVHSLTKDSRCSSSRISSSNRAFQTAPFTRGSGHFQLRNRQEHALGNAEPEAFTKEFVQNCTSPSADRVPSHTPLQAQALSPICSSQPAEGASSPRAVPDQQRVARPHLLDMVTDLSSLENDYRVLPLLIGCIIPVSILINVPSITSEWVGKHSYNETIQDWNDPVPESNPVWLNTIVSIALAMAVICNICVLFRFLERWIWHNVILSLITATIQDILCIAAIVPFCLLYPPSEGYVYLEGFWTMIASMIFSFTATILMSIDLHTTPNFRLRGSGVTHKQRILIAEAMTLCFYLAIGALIFIYLEDWTFLNALFFVMVTITTIGFGDVVPKTTGGRAFTIFYAAGGIVLLALAVNAIRYVLLEDLHRRFAIRAKERKAKRDAKRQERKDQRARDEERRQRVLETLERIRQMEGEQPRQEETRSLASHYLTMPRQFTLSNMPHLRLPAMFSRNHDNSSLSGRALGSDPTTVDSARSTSSVLAHATPSDRTAQEDTLRSMLTGRELAEHADGVSQPVGSGHDDSELLRYTTLHPQSSQGPQDPKGLKSVLRRFLHLGKLRDHLTAQPRTVEEQREVDKRQAYKESMQEYKRRLRFTALMFLVFWLVGAILFMLVETWSFGISMYFVFVAFSTIGYGDYVPTSLAGRSIFLAYCLVGVVALTSLASLMSEVLSKTMRRHVVEAQLRRAARRFEALEGGHGSQSDNNHDLEAGMRLAAPSLDGYPPDRASDQTSQKPSGESEQRSTRSSCVGSLQKLLRVSEDFDHLLQKVLGRDYIGNSHSHSATTHFTVKDLPPSDPEAIVDYLEKSEDDTEPSYLSPSITNDITSTRTIQRHSLHPLMHDRLGHRRSHSVDNRSNTFHGAISSSPPSNHSQIQITAWPGTPRRSTLSLEPDAHPSEKQSSHKALHHSPKEPSTSNHRASRQHDKDGTITVAVADWERLIECARQFKSLTMACEETLRKVAAWEAAEERLCRRRTQAHLRRKQILQERRRRLEEYRRSHGTVDDEVEEEEEELEQWDEEGSDEEEDDQLLERGRAAIVNELLGTISSPKRGRSRSRSPSRSARQPRGIEVVPRSCLHSPSSSLTSQLQASVGDQDAQLLERHQSRDHAKDPHTHRWRRKYRDEGLFRTGREGTSSTASSGLVPTIALTEASTPNLGG